MKWVGYIALGLFVGTVFAANWAIERWGVVPVGFGLEAPAAVYFVGLAFTLRDTVHRTLGRWHVVGAIILGAVLSYAVSPAFAVASGVAFLCSELADLAVYEPLRSRSMYGAVAASNALGIVVDSALFLWLAFGSLAFFWGQVVGKAWMTVLALLVLLVLSQWRVRPA